MTTPIAIIGAAGRMGRRLLALADNRDLTVVSAVVHASEPCLGQDIGTLIDGTPLDRPITCDITGDPKVAIDFSAPDALMQIIPVCKQRGIALVTGTTGLTDAHHAALDDLAQHVAVLQAPNMALGVNLVFAVAGQIAAMLQQTAGDDYDIEVTEAHHRHKKDAPSGTALGIVESICKATGKSMKDDVIYGREGEALRKPGEIAVHALRMGSVVGDHAVTFGSPEEMIMLSHRAQTRDVFADGALVAAKWLSDQPAGRYGMADVLGL